MIPQCKKKKYKDMSKEEYIKWKEENSSEYNSVLLRLMELVFKDLLSHSLDDVFLECITPDAERRNVSYRDVVMALSGDEDKFLRGNGTWAIPEKLDSSSYTTVTIDTSDWTANPDGGYMFTYTLPTTMPYDNFNFDVVLSADQSAAKLQIEAWSCVIADGNITQTTSNSSTTAFTFYAFTTQPSVALTVGIQGVS